MQRQTVLLNNEALSRIIAEREVKQWLLARRIGVDRKTITRWINGKTQRISRDNITRLAEELACSVDDLTVKDTLEALGTREDRWAAARQLRDKDLVNMVGSSYNWDLAESLIRSNIDVEMPADLQASLYIKLARCGMYSHKPDLVKSSAEIAVNRATDAEDESLILYAKQLLGTYYLMIGNMGEVISRYTEVLVGREHFDSETRLASILCNFGLALWSIAEFGRAKAAFDEAMPLWERNEPVVSTTTAWWLRAKLYVELSMVEECLYDIERCEAISQQINYAKCSNMCVAIRAELASIAGEHDKALELADEANRVFRETPTVNPASLESIARVWRRAGRVEQALEEINRLIDSKHEDQFHYARYRQEKARTLVALGREAEAWQEIELSNAVFLEFGAPLRILKELPVEYYAHFRLS
ncbi:helix-turn-helix transcriptional regulator [bacterium]|nr:helix-turn-helix transcriptional regulator [bacterium]